MEEIKKRILSKLEEIKEKIVSNEPYPEKEQNLDDLSNIEDSLDNVLNNWYY